jgi:hypothetical protein
MLSAISFSTPLPTLQYYSWLFGNDIANADPEYTQPQLGTTRKAGFLNNDMQDPFQTKSFDSTCRSPSHLAQTGQQSSSTALSQLRNQNTGIYSPRPHPGQTVGHGLAVEQPPLSDGIASYLSSPSNQGRSSGLGVVGLDSTHSYLSSSQPFNSVAHTPTLSVDPYDLPLPDSYVQRRPPKLPIMTNEARDGLMQLVSQSRPRRTDMSEISPCEPHLSLPSLQHYSDLFFTRFNLTYPLIHQETFQPSTAHPLQLMSIILLGATYSDKQSHLLAVCIHDIMRPLIHSCKDFGPKPKLWMLQTILLVECFGKSRAGDRQHDMSNIYHGLQIKYVACFSLPLPL